MTVTPQGLQVPFAAAGSPGHWTGASFTLAPAAAGDFIIAEAVAQSAADFAASLSSSNVTWTVLAGPTVCPANSYNATVFIGLVTSTSSQTVTVTYNAGSPFTEGQWMEFSTTAGYVNVKLDGTGTTIATSTNTYPSITPSHGSGELYYGFAFNNGSASAGSTPGYTYNPDVAGNGACWNPACTTSAQAPVWGDTDIRDGLAVLLYEAGGPPSLPGGVPAGSIASLVATGMV